MGDGSKIFFNLKKSLIFKLKRKKYLSKKFNEHWNSQYSTIFSMFLVLEFIRYRFVVLQPSPDQ